MDKPKRGAVISDGGVCGRVVWSHEQEGIVKEEKVMMEVTRGPHD